MDKYLAVDIGGTYIKYALIDKEGKIHEKGKWETTLEPQDYFINSLVELYRSVGENAAGIAVSSAGMIDSPNGFMYNAGSINCVQNLEFVAEMEALCGVPVSIENDAKCAALAEMWKGSLKDCSNAVVIVIGTAVGGAVIINRQVLAGTHFMGGEFSYILTDGEPADDSEQILALTGGMPAMIKLASRQSGIAEAQLNGEKIFEMAMGGNQTMKTVIRTYARRLAVQIMNLQFIVDPERFAIGGGVSTQTLLLKYIREELEKLATLYPYSVPIPEVTNCKYFNDSNLIGALYVLLAQINKN